MNFITALLLGCFLFFIGQALIWFQVNGQFFWPWFKNHDFIVALIFSIPISLLFIWGNRFLYTALDGSLWSIRLMTFGVGIIVFLFLTWLIGKELPNMKNIICIVLSITIILIQIFWK